VRGLDVVGIATGNISIWMGVRRGRKDGRRISRRRIDWVMRIFKAGDYDMTTPQI